MRPSTPFISPAPHTLNVHDQGLGTRLFKENKGCTIIVVLTIAQKPGISLLHGLSLWSST